MSTTAKSKQTLARQDILQLRQQIAKIDQAFLREFKKYLSARARIVNRMGRIKRQNRIQIKDTRIEKNVRSRFQSAIGGKIAAPVVDKLVTAILSESRKIQKQS